MLCGAWLLEIVTDSLCIYPESTGLSAFTLNSYSDMEISRTISASVVNCFIATGKWFSRLMFRYGHDLHNFIIHNRLSDVMLPMEIISKPSSPIWTRRTQSIIHPLDGHITWSMPQQIDEIENERKATATTTTTTEYKEWKRRSEASGSQSVMYIVELRCENDVSSNLFILFYLCFAYKFSTRVLVRLRLSRRDDTLTHSKHG